ncbi:hypothetical protein Back2_09810 [Nocardioides baekrokdamisoli]|uniref:HTH luxR-type domain-containing protein n=1 Tax=Nocardioides baekrokdamisoli TaxID=1804624 RepID=A0A3G9IZS1_9ACTN|nr:helix-turn-helix transcriptional regulator [Nocardioides baekrokdamisoli]BBH16694.1 hypothetical protein Back2_09810 [Nocardioides baekrokdamisoli]
MSNTVSKSVASHAVDAHTAVEAAARGWGPQAPTVGTDEQALLLAEMDMWARIEAGDFDRATAAASRLLIVSTDPPQRGRVEAAIGVMMQRAGLMADAREQFERALALVAGSASDEAMFLAVSSLSRVLGGDIAGAEMQAERAIALGEQSGIDFAVRQGLTTMAAVHLANGLPHVALLDAQKAVGLATQGEAQAEYRSTAHVLLGMARAELDQLPEAHEAILTGVKIAEDEGDTGQLSWYLASNALLHVIDGEWDNAIRDCQAALRVARETGAVAARPLAWGIWATIEAARAKSSQAANLIQQARSHRLGPYGGLGEEWVALAQAANSHDGNERYDLLCEAWFRLRGAPFLLAWRVFAPQLVHEAMDRNDLGVASTVTATAMEGARRAPGVASALATAKVCEGLLNRDPVVCQAGVDAQRGTGRPPTHALFCMDAARLWQESGEKDRAIVLLQEASTIVHTLHATRWSALVGRMLGAGSVPAPRNVPPDAWGELTPTERHVARLAAAGRTNPEIAAELVVSPRTVQTHMAHIHAKFGVSSRVQLAAHLAGSDLG